MSSQRFSTVVVSTLLIVATSLTTTSTARSPEQAVTVPFEIVNRHILFRASVNGSRPLWFVFDTGATQAIIKLEVAKSLGLQLYGTANGGGAGPARTTGSLVRDAKWTLPELKKFAQPMKIALPLSRLAPSLGHEVDGIIGGEFIRQFVVEVDYMTRRLILHNRSGFRYTGSGEALPIEFNADGHPVVHAEVTPIGGQPLPGSFLFDLGAGGALVLHRPFVQQHQLPGPDLPTVPATGGGGGGDITGVVGHVGEVKIGSFKIARPLTLFSADRAGAFANPLLAGNIGSQIANRFTVFLDYDRKRIILEPLRDPGPPFDPAFSGLVVFGEGEDYRTFRVDRVIAGSVAANAGLRVGDVITAVDSTPAAHLTLTDVVEALSRTTTSRLSIRRGEEAFVVDLTPRLIGG